jgi:Rieske Fe-S protein
VSTQPRDEPRPTRRGLLLGVGLAGVGGTLAGCSTAAVPYGANEAGVVPQDGPAPSSMAMAPSPAVSSSMATQGGSARARKRERATGTVLGAAREIPVGGGMIFTTARVVVTQPARGQYRAFSAVCTHVGCILNQVTGGTINCPCHGSRFTITSGAVVAGPAPTPLPRKQIKIVDGMVVLT